MEKLMDTDPYNRAMPKKLIGHDMFGDTYPTCSTTCQKQTDCDDCPIQEAFASLRQYEKTGIDPEEIMELNERDTAKAPEEIQDAYGDTRLICPNCRNSVINYFNRSRPPQFCMICGQRLKFGE